MAPQTFFAVLCLLHLLDAWTTYRGLKAGASEANPIIRAAIRKTRSLKGGLFLVKVPILAWVWFHPIAAPAEQAILAAVYLVTIAHNYKAAK